MAIANGLKLQSRLCDDPFISDRRPSDPVQPGQSGVTSGCSAWKPPESSTGTSDHIALMEVDFPGDEVRGALGHLEVNGNPFGLAQRIAVNP